MFSSYHNSRQKAIFWLIIAISFFYCFSAKAIVPNDQKFYLQENIWNLVNAPRAWDFATGTKRTVIAVIDIGVDIKNSDLVDNIWLNLDEIADNGIDDDNNGYVDDVNGWNFVENNNQVIVPNVSSIEDIDITSHGTMAAGLVGAKGNNNVNGVGLNWQT
jgi:subtilisin family serine protease